MEYSQLQEMDRKNRESWDDYARRAAAVIEEIRGEFRSYLGSGGDEAILSTVPFYGRREGEAVPPPSGKALEWGEEGWVGGALRLVIGQTAYLIRFLLKEDGDCWILKPFEERTEYPLSPKDRRANRETLTPFFDQVSEALGEWLEGDFECWREGTVSERPPFLVEEKSVLLPEDRPIPDPEERVHGIFPFLYIPR